jgi:hypothetical protein
VVYIPPPTTNRIKKTIKKHNTQAQHTNQNILHNEKEPSPNVDSVNANDITELEEGEEKTEDLLKEVFAHVRKKLKRDDI